MPLKWHKIAQNGEKWRNPAKKNFLKIFDLLTIFGHFWTIFGPFWTILSHPTKKIFPEMAKFGPKYQKMSKKCHNITQNRHKIRFWAKKNFFFENFRFLTIFAQKIAIISKGPFPLLLRQQYDQRAKKIFPENGEIRPKIPNNVEKCHNITQNRHKIRFWAKKIFFENFRFLTIFAQKIAIISKGPCPFIATSAIRPKGPKIFSRKMAKFGPKYQIMSKKCHNITQNRHKIRFWAKKFFSKIFDF